MALTSANNNLALDIHRLLSEEEGNVFFSPLSLSAALSMLLYAAQGETESEMRKVLACDLNISGKDLATAFERQTSVLLKCTDSYTLNSANAMLIQNGFEIKSDYKSVLGEFFKAMLFEVDFQTENTDGINQINDWIKEKTNDMIPKFIESLNFSDSVLMVLNAVYFKGYWLRQFDKESISSQKFYNKGIEEEAKLVDMMHQKDYFRYIRKESFKALQLCYSFEQVAMLVLLPHERDGLATLEASLTASFVFELTSKMYRKNMKVVIPRFRLEYSKQLVPVFQKLGVNKVFSQEAELGGASDSEKIAVSNILHKTVLEVNEEGSDPAPASMISVNYCTTLFPEIEFVADHPFVFVIYDISSSLILFMGRVDEL